ncbi:MAG: lipid A biosynthesis acyltransferase, partial [Nevskiales bacterium]
AVQASKGYLKRIHRREVGWPEVARHIHRFACVILDRVFLITGRYQELDIRIHGEELALQYANRQGGCLLVGSHLGSFEVLRALGSRHDEVNIRMLMARGQNEMITQILEALNPGIGEIMIDTSGGDADTALRIKEALDEDSMVCLLGDRVNSENEKSAACDFLGSQAQFPLGWLLLAAVLKVPVLLCFGLYQGGNRYDIHFELLADEIALTRNKREAEAAVWAQRYADRLAHHARSTPYNWFNFYDFWETRATSR